MLEARALGVLVEKALTVPDSYPLSLNSLMLGCNQKTARDPVSAASEDEIEVAIDGLKSLDLAFESSGSRVRRYAHNMGRALGVPSQSVALLTTLMLRGPQTGSELRANCERLHRFADLSAVEGFLDELAARASDKGGALVLKLPRVPGSREARCTHLLCGMPDPSAPNAPVEGYPIVPLTELAAMKSDQAALRSELDELRAQVERLCAELGVKRE